MTKTIAFDKPMLARLKEAYAAAPGDGSSVFVFEGNEYVKAYAKYLIEYLEDRFKT